MSTSPFLTGNYAPVIDERTDHDLAVDGHLPPGLRGTLFRNGSNPRFPPAEPYHWFTGDGMVHAITLSEKGASYRNRWVRTPRFLAEAEAGRALFAGFGQPLTEEAGKLDTGVANTHVLAFAGRLLALEEGHLPVRLDPGDLSVIGYEDFGSLTGPFTAHPKLDPVTGELIFFSYFATGTLSPTMSWGTVTPDGRVSRRELFTAPFAAMVHDFAVTATHVVVPVFPLIADMQRAMAGGPLLAWDPSQGAQLGVMRRDRGVAGLVWAGIDPRFVFHVMNAFDADGDVVMDVVEYDAPPLFPRADGAAPDPASARSRLCRWRIDAAGHGPLRREVIDQLSGEFPRIDERRAGLPYRMGVRIGEAPDGNGREAILRTDLHDGRQMALVLGNGERVSEAVFVPESPAAAEGEGWLLCVVWRTETADSVLYVLDARAVDRGPVATVRLPRRVPFGFHGSWVPEAD